MTMKTTDHFPLDPELKESLQVLDDIPPRDANAAVRGRNLFLAEAQALKHSAALPAKRQHKKWVDKIQSGFPFKKEGVPVLSQIVAAVLILITILGGAGAGTVYAAQTSLPNELLYPVKTWSENARLELATSPEQDIDLLLKFADRRIEEMLTLTEEGTMVPDPVVTQLQTHLELALQQCDRVKDPQQARQRIHQKLMNQQRLLTQAPETAQLLRTRKMLQQRIQQVDQLQDPTLQQDTLPQPDRDRLRTGQPESAGNPDADGNPQDLDAGGPNPNPGTGGQGPHGTMTPMPGQRQDPNNPGNHNGPGK